MCVDRGAFHYYVIDVDLHGIADFFFKDFVYQSLIGSVDVFKAEWHNLVTIGAVLSNKGRFHLVCRVHKNLVVS